MKKLFCFLNLFVILFSACERRNLRDLSYLSARVPVNVIWTESGMNPALFDDDNLVHRVSFRFFPKEEDENGIGVFERYLEGNVYNGYIEVPIGEYDILVMNESVQDSYWNDHYSFEKMDSFDSISVSVKDIDPGILDSQFDYYDPSSGERFITSSHVLSTCVIEDFVVNQDMVTNTRSSKLTKAQESEFAITANMRRLVSNATVKIKAANAGSVYKLRGSVTGLAKKLYLASGVPAPVPATHIFNFNTKVLTEGNDGVISYKFKTFGPLSKNPANSFEINVIMIDGSNYRPQFPEYPEDVEDREDFKWDVTTEVTEPVTEFELLIEQDVKLPEIKEGIHVGGWGPEDDIILN